MDSYNKYAICLRMESKIKDIKQRMKIIKIKVLKLDEYYGDYLYAPHD